MAETLHIYSRVSTKSQEDNTSLEQQRSKGRALAERLGMDHKIWDEGVASSSSDDIEDREVLTEMMSEVFTGSIRHLYAEYTDRLSRNQKTWSAIRFYLQRQSVVLYTGSDPNPIDLNDPMDELLLTVVSAVNVFENRQRTTRLNNGKFERVKSGGWHGGPAPFGYQIKEKTLVECPDQGAWVEKIFTEFARTKSSSAVKDLLMKNGVLTNRGGIVWNTVSVDKLLTNRHYNGSYLVTRGKKVWNSDQKKYERKVIDTYEQECPRLVDPPLYKQVQDILNNRSNSNRGKQPNEKHFYLLKDILYCGHCGSGMRGRIYDKKNISEYYCDNKPSKLYGRSDNQKTCNKQSKMDLDIAEQTIWDAVINTLENSNLFKNQIKQSTLDQSKTYARSKKEIASDKRQLRDIDKELKKLRELKTSITIDTLVDADTSKSDYLNQINERILDSEVRRTDILNRIENTSNDQKWIDWLSKFSNIIDHYRSNDDPEQKRELLTSIVKSIDVYTENSGGKYHRMEIRFTVGFEKDELRYNDPRDKSKGYEIVDGIDYLSVSTDPKKKG